MNSTGAAAAGDDDDDADGTRTNEVADTKRTLYEHDCCDGYFKLRVRMGSFSRLSMGPKKVTYCKNTHDSAVVAPTTLDIA